MIFVFYLCLLREFVQFYSRCVCGIFLHFSFAECKLKMVSWSSIRLLSFYIIMYFSFSHRVIISTRQISCGGTMKNNDYDVFVYIYRNVVHSTISNRCWKKTVKIKKINQLRERLRRKNCNFSFSGRRWVSWIQWLQRRKWLKTTKPADREFSNESIHENVHSPYSIQSNAKKMCWATWDFAVYIGTSFCFFPGLFFWKHLMENIIFLFQSFFAHQLRWREKGKSISIYCFSNIFIKNVQALPMVKLCVLFCFLQKEKNIEMHFWIVWESNFSEKKRNKAEEFNQNLPFKHSDRVSLSVWMFNKRERALENELHFQF